MKKKPKVFLGGTCNGSRWRDELIPELTIDYFNPVVDDWNEEAQKEEERQKEACDILLFVITPEMAGVFSIAEVIQYSNKRPQDTVFFYNEYGFKSELKKSLEAVQRLVFNNGAKVQDDVPSLIELLNRWGHND